MKRIRGRPITPLVMRIASRMKSQCSELEQAINRRAESIRSKKVLKEAEIEDQKEFIKETNDKMKGVFGLIGLRGESWRERCWRTASSDRN